MFDDEPVGSIRVLIVDDSAVNRDFLTSIIETDPVFTIVGYASNGEEAIHAVRELSPSIITMDLDMPVMDGFEAIEKIMAYYPTPILVVTAIEFQKDSTIAFDALAVGALDIINRPQLPDNVDDSIVSSSGTEFLAKLKLLSQIKVITHVRGKLNRRARSDKELGSSAVWRLVIIASSTGGPKALKEIFDHLPADFPSPVLVVQHMSDGFVPGLARWLDSTCNLTIAVAVENEMIKPGSIYIAPTGYHLTIKKGGMLSLLDHPPINGLRPCADVLIESAVNAYGSRVVGVILSGMGNDGTRGSSLIKQAGGKVIVQDRTTCVIPSMPQNVIAAGTADSIHPLTEIALELQKIVTSI